MTAAKEGDTVRVHYSGTLKDGTEFDSSRDSSALEFTIGQGQIISGFETAVIGMNPGESKTVEIPSTEAYGPHRAELTQEVERRLLPPDIDVQPGTQLQASGPNQQPLVVTVAEVMPESVILDANHPLAGEDLTFDIELVELL
ncbi:MAG TPA: peptidylprolyl isomerase [Kiloniellales bacterium]|nr:peptidylprolyl isomerase [Kiloniellales bacterium]